MSTPDVAPSAASESISPRVLENDPIGRVALRKTSLRLLPLIGIGYGIAFIVMVLKCSERRARAESVSTVV